MQLYLNMTILEAQNNFQFNICTFSLFLHFIEKVDIDFQSNLSFILFNKKWFLNKIGSQLKISYFSRVGNRKIWFKSMSTLGCLIEQSKSKTLFSGCIIKLSTFTSISPTIRKKEQKIMKIKCLHRSRNKS